LNPFSHFLEHVFTFSNTFIISYVCWIILFSTGIILKPKLSNNIVLVPILVINSFLPILYGDPFDIISSIHIAVVVWLAFSFCISLRFKPLSKKNIIFIYKVISLIGLISCIYAMISQFENFISILHGENIRLNSWSYVSFYRQRNIFGEYCFISSVAALYVYMATHKRLYLWILAINGLHVLILDSRAALIAYGILMFVSLLLLSNNKKKFLLIGLIILFLVLYVIGGVDTIIGKFTHTIETEDTDSGAIRLMMWQTCISYLINNLGIFFGFGFGSVGKFLKPLFDLGSSHSVYIDSLFDGGLVFFAIVLFSLLFSFKRVLYKADVLYQKIHIGAFLAYFFYCFVEAGMAPFMSSYFSVSASLIFIMIPNNYELTKVKSQLNNNNKNRVKYEEMCDERVTITVP